MTATTLTVRDIALQQPSSIRVFEAFGIDYCCGGRKPLEEACAAKSLETTEVLAALQAAAQGSVAVAEDWQHASLESLCQHIVLRHHAYVKSELPRLAMLAQKVVHRHGETQAHLLVLQEKLAALDAELSAHLMKEEAILFPYVVELERALVEGGAKPHGCFHSVESPIAMMTSEHEAAGGLLAEMRVLSGEFTPPLGACPTYCAYYAGLKEFEQDLHRHIHLENNILFPRAIEMERTFPPK